MLYTKKAIYYPMFLAHANASRLLQMFYVTSVVPLTLTPKYSTFIFLNHNLDVELVQLPIAWYNIKQRLTEIETLDLREIESSTVLKLSPVVKRWRVRGDSFGTYGMCPLRQLTSGGRFLHVAKRSPDAQIYDSGQNFRGDNLFRDTGMRRLRG